MFLSEFIGVLLLSQTFDLSIIEIALTISGIKPIHLASNVEAVLSTVRLSIPFIICGHNDEP
jgi:hypothetical protein